MDPDKTELEAQRKRVIAGRNRALALVLAGLCVLFFLITIAKRAAL